MTVTFQPLGAHLLLALEPEPSQSSVIQVQKSLVDLVRYGRVTAIGPEVRDVQVGQRVIASVTAGIELKDGMLVTEKAVLSFVEADDAV